MDNEEIEDKGILVEHIVGDDLLLEEEAKKQLQVKKNLI